MTKRLSVAAMIAASISLATAGTAPAAGLKPLAKQAPESALATADATTPACTTPAPTVKYAWLHCYGAQNIRDAYGVSALPNKGDGQTIVLVDSYGTPTGAQDLQKFHDTYFPGEPDPNYTASYPQGKPDYKNVGNGQSGSAAAEGWAGEATLDIEWAYAMAPHAHIVPARRAAGGDRGRAGLPEPVQGDLGRDRQVPGGHGVLAVLRRDRGDLRRCRPDADRALRRRLQEGRREGRHGPGVVGR